LQAALLLVIGVALCSGCGSSNKPAANNSPPPPQPSATPATPAPAPPAIPTQPLPTTVAPPTVSPTPPPTEAQIPNPPQPAPTTLPEPPATPGDTVKAGVGTTNEGRTLDNLDAVQNAIAYPAKTFFAVREKVKFQIEIPSAYKLYKAENETPLTFDEFKQKVLDPNNIKLPMLPPGHSYEWDPEKEELMVRQPKK
jgi:hypothetical protein